MLICWIIGHRYDYDIKKQELLALVCTRCGDMKILQETRIEVRPSPSPHCTPSVPPRSNPDRPS